MAQKIIAVNLFFPACRRARLIHQPGLGEDREVALVIGRPQGRLVAVGSAHDGERAEAGLVD